MTLSNLDDKCEINHREVVNLTKMHDTGKESIPKPRSIRYSFFSSTDPGCPSRKFSGFTSP